MTNTRRRLGVLTLLLVALFMSCHAATYSPETVPNVYLTDSTRLVSNPDGILSPEAEMQTNELLRTLLRNTSAECVVVCVDALDRDIVGFSNELFNQWKLGKKDTKNGLLLVVAKDSHEVRFTTGAGLEGLLPDGLLGTIIRQEMIPHFKDNAFDSGVIAGISAVSTILSSPEGRQEIMSKYKNHGEEETTDLFNVYLSLCVLLTVALSAWFIATLFASMKKSRLLRYQALDRLTIPLIICSFLSLGMGLIVLIPLLLMRHNLRRGKHLCPSCSTRMQLVDEEHDNDYLDRGSDLEEQYGSVDYDVWLCPKCAATEIIPYAQRNTQFTECPVCHKRTYRLVSNTEVAPTASRNGWRVITRECVNCGHRDNETQTIEREPGLTAPLIIPGGGGGSGAFGGGSGGGSFGGGFTSGGGAGGSW